MCKKLVIVMFLMTVGRAVPVLADDAVPAVVLPQQNDAIVLSLTQENVRLKEQLRLLETTSISGEFLLQKSYARLVEVARDTKAQRQSMTDFEGYVKWMSTNISGYSKYMEAGSVAAGFARVLPIPYAGQASLFTKFVSNAALSLNSASVAMNRYLATSQQFTGRVESLDAAKVTGREISELARFADEQLLRDMNDAQLKLATTADISASALAFLESLNHYVGSTDEYWNKTKSLLKRGDADKKEKSFLCENIESLKNRAAGFNGKFKQFNEAARKDAPLIKSLVAYDELLRQLDTRVAQPVKQ
jgi:hypothetical protein